MPLLKRLEELTHDEILAIKIGSDEYNTIIDLECAHAGISLLPPHPGPKPETEGSKPDGVLYKIGSLGFLKIEDAEEVVQLMITKGLWKTESQKGVYVIEQMLPNDYHFPEIKSTSAFTASGFANVKDAVTKQSALLAIWDESNRVYSAVLKEREGIVKEFNEKIEYAREVNYGIDQIKSNLKRYLTLAQGTYSIAVDFLKEADKGNKVLVDEGDVYYASTSGEHHLVITREQYQQDSMNNLLEA